LERREKKKKSAKMDKIARTGGIPVSPRKREKASLTKKRSYAAGLFLQKKTDEKDNLKRRGDRLGKSRPAKKNGFFISRRPKEKTPSVCEGGVSGTRGLPVFSIRPA